MNQSVKTFIKISHRTKSNLSYESLLELKELTLNERLLNGFKFLGLSILAGLVLIFIPVLHFVLVPGSLMVGIFLFYRQLNFKTFRLEKTISCPECKKTFKLKAKPVKWPMNEICDNCLAQVLIEKTKS